MNRKVEILIEMLGIYKKYLNACEAIGTISMSPADKTRLKELESELEKLK